MLPKTAIAKTLIQLRQNGTDLKKHHHNRSILVQGDWGKAPQAGFFSRTTIFRSSQ
jgi:hypothetical protein